MPDHPSLTLHRHISASPAKVFSAWTDPQQIVKWLHPGGCNVVHAEMELKAGGRFHMIMRAPDGEEHDVSGVFREVAMNEKLVYTWAFRSTPERESVVTFTLKADGYGTWLTLKHEQFFDEAARDAHRGGWSEALDGLEHYFL
ncbi:SRPBCC domain-containing protein [Paraburkholderia sp. CNPSo 3157]|uniref:SRPBCC domain-containing protein n=1 Tax=Paraburkholderia franconis TaxID=2654983 RepID=A0A7X1NCW2_9BURK|nr:SRPBCC domain-containing protein [Paraburkholderia franconis]MPW19178.1 SRPBCC domain-containing protein [Paraburkholderia franconis]